jgi:L-ascorbate metabolism protein UlaG (beta-lactamase superfamily)
MKRRQFLGYAGAGAATVAASGFWDAVQAQSGGLSVTSLGHMCFLFSGSGKRVLVNPFKSLGCTAGYRPPNVSTDLVLISSQLLDEGAVDVVPGNPKLLYQSGAYDVSGLKLQGIDTDHDKMEGKQFGRNIAWKWNQGGISILHLGGAAAPITLEQKILMGTPDILFIPVGGGPKAYNPEDAKQAIGVLNPKLVVPTQYRTSAAKDQCDLVGLDSFLGLMSGTPIRKGGNSLSLGRGDIPKQMTIQVMNY